MRINLPIFETESRRQSLFNGSFLRLLPTEERLSHREEDGEFARVSADAALARVSGVSRQDYEYFAENPAILSRPFIRNNADGFHIGIFDLVAAIVEIPTWHRENRWARHIIVRADSINVFDLPDSGKAKEGVIPRIRRVFLQRCIGNDVEVTPRYIRSGHYLSGDGLKRWPPEEALEWSVAQLMV